jgi:hypothetical protein
MPPSQIPRGSANVPSKVGKARRRRPIFAARAAFVSRNGAFAPEVWDTGGAASLPIFTRCCRTAARAAARSFALEGHPLACPISLGRRGKLVYDLPSPVACTVETTMLPSFVLQRLSL